MLRAMLWQLRAGLWPGLRVRLRPQLWWHVRIILRTPLWPNLRFPLWRGSVWVRTLLRQLLRRPVMRTRLRSVWPGTVRSRLLWQLRAELWRRARSVRSGLLPDANLRDHARASAGINEPTRLSASGWPRGEQRPTDHHSEAASGAA